MIDGKLGRAGKERPVVEYKPEGMKEKVGLALRKKKGARREKQAERKMQKKRRQKKGGNGRSRTGIIRKINREWPWVKIVVGILVPILIVGFGMVAAGWMRGATGTASGGNGVRGLNEVGAGFGRVEEGKKKAKKVEKKEVEESKRKEDKTAEVEKRKKSLEGKMLVALTFDDGPSVGVTERILGVLKEKEVRATFFMLGRMVDARPEVARRVAEEGHEVESHTYAHANLGRMGGGDVKNDVQAAREAILRATGVEVGLVRLPYGNAPENAGEVVGTPMIKWTVDPDDWRDRDAGVIRERVVGASFDGAIILLHDIYETTADALVGIIDDLRGRGYEFATVRELAEAKGVELKVGEVYRGF